MEYRNGFNGKFKTINIKTRTQIQSTPITIPYTLSEIFQQAKF